MPPNLLAALSGVATFVSLQRTALLDADRLWSSLADLPPADERKHLAVALLGMPLIIPAALAVGLLRPTPAAPAMGPLSPMAIDSPMGAALAGLVFPPQLQGISPGAAATTDLFAGAVAAYLGAIASILGTAAMLWLFAQVSGARRDAGGCLRVASWGSQPFWLSCIGLTDPSMLPLLAVGLLHACHVTHSGVCRRLDASASDGAALLGIVALTMLVAAPLASYLASALLGMALRLAG